MKNEVTPRSEQVILPVFGRRVNSYLRASIPSWPWYTINYVISTNNLEM